MKKPITTAIIMVAPIKRRKKVAPSVISKYAHRNKKAPLNIVTPSLKAPAAIK